MNIEILGWISTILLWSSFFPKSRFYLHLIGLIASITRLIYFIILYYGSTGDLARPLIANWSVMVLVHIVSLYRFRNN